MFSYFAIIGKNANSYHEINMIEEQIKRKFPQYQTTFKVNDLCYLERTHNNSLIKRYTLENNTGIIVGTLFKRTNIKIGEQVNQKISPDESFEIIKTAGKHLIDNYWGSYIAFIKDNNKYSAHVIRDPSGFLLGHYYENDNYVIFFSDIEDFLSLNLKHFFIDNQHIAAACKYDSFEYDSPALKEMKKLLPGQSLQINERTTQLKWYWHPSMFCKTPRYTDPQAAISDLRRIVEECVHAWSNEFKDILLYFSGGLDSTILLSCLKSAPNNPNITCLHYYRNGTAEDDREYARSAAEHFEQPIIEVELDVRKANWSDIWDYIQEPDPRCLGFTFADGQTIPAISRTQNIDVLMTGEGGDEVFLSHPMYIAEEYINYNGFGFEFLREAIRFAHALNTSYSRIILNGLKSVILQPVYSVDNIIDLYPSEIMTTLSYENTKIDQFLSWLYRPLSSVPAAKINQITFTSIARSIQCPIHREKYKPMCRPLLSQPIRELVYTIPCYMFPYKGVTRGLARMAFIGLAPQRNILRQAKAAANSHIHDILIQNIDFLHEFFRDCKLVDLGIWDSNKLKQALSGDPTSGLMLELDFIRGIGIELWLKKMTAMGAKLNIQNIP